jgi:tRNA pseudouridine55 synthase
VYDATIALGASTTTGDPTGEVVREAPLPQAEAPEVERILQAFVGDRMQEPPAYSAVKHEGKPLYHYARKGQEVRVPARPITISSVALQSYDQRTLRVLITCSRGTYARVLADEIAVALGSAGHLQALERPRSGPFFLDDAVTMDKLAELASAEPGRTWNDVLIARSRKGERVPWRPRDEGWEALAPWLRRPLDALSNLPLADVRPSDAARVRRGAVAPPPPPGVEIGGRYIVVCGDEVIAVIEATPRGPKTLRVLDGTE